MKKLLAIVLLAASTLAAQSAPADPYAEKARKLVDQMIQALGGQAYLSYSTRAEDGRTYSFYQGQPRGSGELYWRMWQFPDKERVELTKQRDIAYLTVGDASYEITFRGTALQEADVVDDLLRRRAHSMEIVTRQWLKDPATVILPNGTAIAEQKLCDLVTIINPQNDSVTIAIDQVSHLPIQKTFTYRDKDRYKVEESEVFGNYRDQQGIMTPFTWTRKKDGLMLTQRFLGHIEYNAAIAPGKFDAKVTYDPKQMAPRKK